MEPVKLDELTWPDIRELIDSGHTTLLFPAGTLEAHGQHAPVGTDNFCAEEIAWRLSDKLGWPVAPTLNYGITTGLIAYPGSQRIDRELYGELVANILDDFFQMGFRQVVIINGHGGNTETLSNVAKELIVNDRGNRHIVIVDWWQLDEEALREVYGRPGGHAALDETAAIVAFRPETLKPENITDGDSWTFTKGVVSLPYPAAMLFYEEGDASPDFDMEKAEKFMSIILEKIEEVIVREVSLFERTFGED